MAITDLSLARAWVRTTLLGITVANGYGVEIKTSDGQLDENQHKTPAALLPRAWVYVGDGEGPTLQPITHGKGTATLPLTIDILFNAALKKSDGSGKHGHDACDTWVAAVAKALRIAQTDPAYTSPWRATVVGAAGYFYSTGALTGVRIPVTIECWYTRSEG